MAAFTGIEVAGSGLVRFTVGAERQVTVETDANILPYIRTEVRGGVLVLSVEPGVSINPTRLVFRITAPDLRSVAIAGSGDVRLESPIKTGAVRRVDRGLGQTSRATSPRTRCPSRSAARVP